MPDKTVLEREENTEKKQHRRGRERKIFFLAIKII